MRVARRCRNQRIGPAPAATAATTASAGTPMNSHTTAAAMSAANLNTVDVRYGVPDVPLIVEDLLCQIEDRAADGDPAVIAQLWAQVDLLQGR